MGTDVEGVNCAYRDFVIQKAISIRNEKRHKFLKGIKKNINVTLIRVLISHKICHSLLVKRITIPCRYCQLPYADCGSF